MNSKWVRIMTRDLSYPVFKAVFILVLCSGCRGSSNSDFLPPCYDENGKAQRCLPAFTNAAYQLDVEVTNTCGETTDTMFCYQAGYKYREPCHICKRGDHPGAYLTDAEQEHDVTWWQSETMLENIQYPNTVNITLHFKKAFDITYTTVTFQSPRPESFAIYKRTKEDGPWIPFQYYSADCERIYGLEDININAARLNATAFCTSEYSDIAPTRGGTVPFSTLKGRRLAHQFDQNEELQEWVAATDIKVVLTRLNTYGDEAFNDPNVRRSYFYAISDIAVGARCKCNGHSNRCIQIHDDEREEPKTVCECQHNTAGDDCEECAPFFQDVPWGRATESDAHECKRCNCNGFSKLCYFDQDLFDRTGHGGHCIDCLGNRDGANCEKCRENFFQPDREDGFCVPCNCDPLGSRSLQCARDGKCKCKPGVTGDKCDRCEDNYYGFSEQGCQKCNCNKDGSLNNTPICEQETGSCLCKDNVEGKECRSCKPGFFSLDLDNEFGCTPCFCYGHSANCAAAPQYSKVYIESRFARSNGKWSARDIYNKNIPIHYDGVTQSIEVNAQGTDHVYFAAPDLFLGDQRASYNQILEFELRLGKVADKKYFKDVILEGGGKSVSISITGQGNTLPSESTAIYRFKLHEQHGWSPRLSSREFMTILSDLTAIKIRGTYSPRGVGFLDNVKLTSARRGAAGEVANWVETCKCPEGYVGQFCESCAPRYRHDPPSSGPFAPCVPCDCNGHGDLCDADTGRCICDHNTDGDFCEKCASGYYGNPLNKTPNDCKPCPCPNQGACTQLHDQVICLECPEGNIGARCELCRDGYYEYERKGNDVKCKPCDCNGNIDTNALGVCNRTTGECLKCIYNTGGPQCEICLSGFYGDALAKKKGDCKPCSCHSLGTEETEEGSIVCDQRSGYCKCKPHVTGKNCDECQSKYYNLESGSGCQPCDCNPIGSVNGSCDVHSGQCFCLPGVTGKSCDQCLPNHYGFSEEGCRPCECDPIGSVELQCDNNGQCRCYPNVVGKHCNRCSENKYDKRKKCIDCPPCYGLVQSAVNNHRSNLTALEDLLENIRTIPTVNDKDFDSNLNKVQERINDLSVKVKAAVGGDDADIEEGVQKLKRILEDSEANIAKARKQKGETEDLIRSITKEYGKVETITKDSKTNLEAAYNELITDGEEYLSKAVNRSTELGQQDSQISEIARQARATAEGQIKSAEETKKLAEQVLNISNEAVEMSKEATKRQGETTKELKDMSDSLDSLKRDLNATARIAEANHNEASTVLDNTIALYSAISGITFPDLDPETLQADAEATEKDGQELVNRADELQGEINNLQGKVNESLIYANKSLENAESLQSKIDGFMKEAIEAREAAEKAAENARRTAKNAEETYNTLRDFDNQIKKSKKMADESLARSEDLDSTLAEVNEKTTNAGEALPSAQINAEHAKTRAREAQNDFMDLGSQAKEVNKFAKDLKEQTMTLNEESLVLVAEIENAQKKLEEVMISPNDASIENANKLVAEAQTNEATATQRMSGAFEEFQKIIKQLNEISELDEENLKQLEDRLKKAESIFLGSNLDEEMSLLMEAKRNQTLLVKRYEDEISRLEADVRNIKAIEVALPDGCYKRVRLEP